MNNVTCSPNRGFLHGPSLFLLFLSACGSRSVSIGDTVDSGTAPPSADGLSSTSPSCAQPMPGTVECGPNHESCCSSLLVPAGQFLRSYDGVTFTDQRAPATLSAFSLDKYEVTVGRFRQFVTATVSGWSPRSRSGTHSHAEGGGLVDPKSGNSEQGWDSGWDSFVLHASAAWDADLKCGSGGGTWTPAPGSHEDLPIGCVNWYQAYAFCIWDGGYLPSESEWNYAASGGQEQRVYPWSMPPTSAAIDCRHANTVGCRLDVQPVGATSPLGDGRWGHSDLTGNVNEWTLDWYETYATPCSDCAPVSGDVTSGRTKVIRGGTLQSDSVVVNARRFSADPRISAGLTGIRCARGDR
jgi:formylglycine-generating enzyme required for sulfatase activity